MLLGVRIIFIFLCLLSNLSFGANSSQYDFDLTKIISDKEIEIVPRDPTNHALVKDLLVIISHETGDVLGYATVTNSKNRAWVATVKMHSNGAMVRVGNYLKKVDLTDHHTEMPGRFDLVRKDQKNISAKFKPLVYLDYQLGQAAATLDEKENLAGLTIYAYGITNHLQIDTTTILDVVKIPNVGIKGNFLRGEDFSVSAYAKYYRYLKYDNRSAFDFELIIDKASNSNMMTFTKLSHKVRRPQGSGILTPNIYTEHSSTEVQTIYGYIFSSWNRLLLGPKYNFEERTVGGAAIYTLFYKHMHWSFALQTPNISNLRLGTESYNYYLDFYWRF